MTFAIEGLGRFKVLRKLQNTLFGCLYHAAKMYTIVSSTGQTEVRVSREKEDQVAIKESDIKCAEAGITINGHRTSERPWYETRAYDFFQSKLKM